MSRGDPLNIEAMEADAPLSKRIAHILKGGAMERAEIQEALEPNPKTLGKTLQRMTGREQIMSLEKGVYGLPCGMPRDMPRDITPP